MNFTKNGARWVWPREAEEENAYAHFFQKFMVSGEGKITLSISADSNYVAYINGRVAAFGQYADFPHYKVYDEIDVTEFVTPGENALAVLGWYCGKDLSVYTVGSAGLIWALESGSGTLCVSGEEALCRPATDCVSGQMEMFSAQLGFSFRHDARGDDGWSATGYKPGKGWAAPVTREAGRLYPRPIKKLRLEARLPVTVLAQGVFTDALGEEAHMGERMLAAWLSSRTLADMTGIKKAPLTLPLEEGVTFCSGGSGGIYIVADLGSEQAGLFDMEISCPEGTVIDIGFGEHLNDLRVRSKIGGRCFAARYIGAGGRQAYTQYIRRIGCRFIELHVHAEEAVLYYAGLRPTPYPISRKGDFRPTDRLHAKIYEVGLHTLQTCMHEHYEDCPWREQALYAMDSRNQMLCGYYAFGEYEFPRASLRLLALSRREDGLLELCAPAKVGVDIPSFSLIWIVALYEYALYSGDLSFAGEMLPTAEGILEVFSSRLSSALLAPLEGYWNFYEWSDGMDGTYERSHPGEKIGADAPLSCFFSLALYAAAELCSFLGLGDKEKRYRELKNSVNKAIYDSFYEPAEKAFHSFISNGVRTHLAELTQALTVCCGACPEDALSGVLSRLASPDNRLVPVTPSHSVFRYEALLKKPDAYGAAVFSEIADKWGAMLFENATTFWETEKGAWDFNCAGSLCHGWSAVPVYLYHAYVLGVKPTAPGFSAYKKTPRPEWTAGAGGIIPTPSGKIHV